MVASNSTALTTCGCRSSSSESEKRQPFQDVAGGLQPAIDVGPGLAAFEPFGAEAAVGVLQAERIAVIVVDEDLGPAEFALDRLAALDRVC